MVAYRAFQEHRVHGSQVRRGLTFRKSHRRDPRSIDYGAYWLIDADRNAVVCGSHQCATLDEVEDWLSD